MYQTTNIIVKQSDSDLYSYCKSFCILAKQMKNTVIYRCRQIVSADNKDTSFLHTNELQVLNEFGLLSDKQNGNKLYLPNYYTFDAVFKQTKNTDYYNALPMQTSQQIIKSVLADFKSYFKALKQFSLHPDKFTGKPKLPNYVKTDEAGFDITNQGAAIKHCNGSVYLKLPKTKATVTLPERITGRLKEVTIKPFYDVYKISIVTETDNATPLMHNNRILGLDLGVNNFATSNNNCGLAPFIVNSRHLKSYNQWYNKELAKLRSFAMQNGHNSSKRIKRLNRNHYCVTHDFYNKTASYIVKYCVSNNISVIVVGKNDGWKQNIDIGKQNNQTFCFLSHAFFIQKLSLMAKRFGIEVIVTEESYTSKASLLSMDTIPTFNENTDTSHLFSGKRIKRGLYQDKNGICINADVNGAGNIIRKVYPNAFETVTDYTYMYQTVNKIQII